MAIHPPTVKAFVEKPNLATAQQYLTEGGYFWNAGMFLLKASVWLEALQQFRPDISQACQAAWASKKQDAQFIRPTEVKNLLGDPNKANQKLGWLPEITVQEMCAEIVAHYLAQAKKHGYKVNVNVE